MKEIPVIDIPYEELKHYVIDCIKTNGDSFEFKNFCSTVGRYVVQKGIVTNPNPSGFQAISFPLQKEDENRVREILWDLIIERVLTLGDYHNATWPWLSLTEYGKTAIASNPPIPNDATGYLKRIKNEIPSLDPIVEVYLMESIQTYNINQLLSATITLGCASEKSLLDLIEIFKNTHKDETKKNGFTKKIDKKPIKTQFDVFDKSMREILNALPYEIRDNYTNTLTGVFQMIRYNRNNAGHPTGTKVDKETLFANLQVFIPYCKYMYDLAHYLEEHKHD